jgi:hypothetical protein
MSENIEGSCACGAVTVRSQEKAKSLCVCHCIDCQKFSGSTYAANVFFSKDAVEVTGEVRSYTSKADSGNDLVRSFCPVCSVVVTLAPMVVPHVLVIPLGVLADRDQYSPKMELFTDRKLPWVQMEGEHQCFSLGPEG